MSSGAKNNAQKCHCRTPEVHRRWSRDAQVEKLKSIRNLRNKHVAHYLTQTRAEKDGEIIAPMKVGDERPVLETSLSVIQLLYCWVNGRRAFPSRSRARLTRNAPRSFGTLRVHHQEVWKLMAASLFWRFGKGSRWPMPLCEEFFKRTDYFG